MFTVFVAETVTGNVIGTLPCVIRNWQRVMGGTDTATIDMMPGALTPQTRDNYRLLTTLWRSSLVLDWDGTAVWAGPLITRDMPGTSVSFGAQGFKALLNRRKLHDWSTPLPNYSVTYSGQSLGQIATQLVQLAISGSKSGASLPVVVPSLTEADSDVTHVRTYTGYELNDIGTALDNLTKSLNGPDIDFMPQWVDATRQKIQWVMRVGTLTNPVLTSAQKVMFDASAPKSSVQKITEKEDASTLVTTEWAKGSGQPPTVLMSKKDSLTLINQGWPLLEGQTNYSTVVVQGTLDAHTQADLNLNGAATTQRDLEVNALLSPTLGSYLLGDTISLRVKDHFWVPDSPPEGYPGRITSITGDNTPTVKLGVQ